MEWSGVGWSGVEWRAGMEDMQDVKWVLSQGWEGISIRLSVQGDWRLNTNLGHLQVA